MKRQAPLGRWVGWRMSLLALGAVLVIAAGMYLWFFFGDWWVLRQVSQAARAEILQLRADPQGHEARLWALFSHYYPVRYFLPGIASRNWWVLAGLLLAAMPLILLAGFRLSRPLSSQFSAIAAAARRVACGDLETRLEVAETAPAELRRLVLDLRQQLFADRDRIGQLLNILLENFLRYGASSGELEIVQLALAEGLVLELRDRGPGIAEVDRERVFHRFWRADSSRARHLGGSGLGLSIARAICAAHQGRIVALERAGGGTVMRIELPGRLA